MGPLEVRLDVTTILAGMQLNLGDKGLMRQ